MTKAVAALVLGIVIPAYGQAQSASADYPLAALREHKEGTTALTVTVDVTGHAKNCIVTKSSGSSDLDAESCRIFMSRGRFSAAKGCQGGADRVDPFQQNHVETAALALPFARPASWVTP